MERWGWIILGIVQKQPIISWLLLLVFLTPSVLTATDLDRTRHILLLNSYNQRMTWVEDVVQGVEDILQPDENNISLHVENLDSKLFYSQEYFDIFHKYLEVKYRATEFSLILSSDNHAYDFLRTHRDTLFPGVPVSFCGVNNFQEEQIESLAGFTGVAEIFSARETIELALQLHPNTTELFIINDYLKTGRAWARDIGTDLQEFVGSLAIRHSANESIEDLMKEIADLGPNTLVLLGVYYSDRDGRYFTYERIGAMLSEASNVPIYCLLEFNIGSGIVGGNVISGYYQGNTMAQIGVQILMGVDPAALPVVKKNNNRYVFDYRQLARFDIHHAPLPAGSEIMYRTYSFYDEYKVQVWVVSGFILALLTTILALIINTARRMNAEGRLRLSEEKFRQLANATWEAIVVHEKGVLLQANDLFFEMFGLTLEEVEGEEFLPFIVSPETVDKARERIAKGDLSLYETIGHHKNGNTFPIEIRVRAMEHKGRNVRVGAIRNLSERKRIEERFAQSQKIEAMGTLSGGIAHDFNNILTAIIGYSELTSLELPPDSKAKKNIGEVLRASKRAKDLVRQILTFARKTKEERQPVHVSLIVKEVLKLLRASLPTSIEIQKNIWSNAQVLSDTTNIHQIMMNLCTNAAKAMPNGGMLTVSLQEVVLDESFVAQHSDVTAGKYLQLIVSDTGSGISPEIKSRIFDPFFTTRSQGEGTGLGLSVVHGLVKDCQGLITVKSEPGQGSTFDVFLPVVDEEKLAQIATNEDLQHGSERILFVDDEQTLVDLAKSMLSKLGYTVTGFTRSHEAIETFRTSPADFDLVITDMTMPKMTGDRLAAELFAIRPDIPIILCTGYTEKISEVEAYKMGIKRFAIKPVNMHTLATIIREVLAIHSPGIDDGDKELDRLGQVESGIMGGNYRL